MFYLSYISENHYNNVHALHICTLPHVSRCFSLCLFFLSVVLFSCANNNIPPASAHVSAIIAFTASFIVFQVLLNLILLCRLLWSRSRSKLRSLMFNLESNSLSKIIHCIIREGSAGINACMCLPQDSCFIRWFCTSMHLSGALPVCLEPAVCYYCVSVRHMRM